MRERHPETRRILLTGYINPELLSRSLEVAGLSACMLKPVRAAELAKAVREALGG
jgi:DNA-binding NarL/FixJ family response regulator